jgi:hypothetical protein
MGIVKKADSFLLRNYRIWAMLLFIAILVIAIMLPVVTFISYKGSLNQDVNPAIINGILTTTSIVFAFAAFELREIKSTNTEKMLLSFPLLIFLMITLEQIFIGAILNRMIAWVALEATANCLFNILYIILLILVKQTHVEIEEKRNRQNISVLEKN